MARFPTNADSKVHGAAWLIPLAMLGCKQPTQTPTPTDTSEPQDTGIPAPDRVVRAIRGDLATSWVFEVDAVGTRTLEDSSMTGIIEVLEQLVDKPGGIRFETDDTLEGKLLWSDNDLFEIARSSFDDAGGPDTLTTHVMLLDGQPPTADVLGLSWDRTHVALFTDVIVSYCTAGPGDPTRICPEMERSILLHEIGHQIGLVNSGLPMVSDHEDPEHAGHDVNPDCLMYWAYERGALGQRIQQQGPNASLDFDAACLADIQAIRTY